MFEKGKNVPPFIYYWLFRQPQLKSIGSPLSPDEILYFLNLWKYFGIFYVNSLLIVFLRLLKMRDILYMKCGKYINSWVKWVRMLWCKLSSPTPAPASQCHTVHPVLCERFHCFCFLLQPTVLFSNSLLFSKTNQTETFDDPYQSLQLLKLLLFLETLGDNVLYFREYL